MNRERVTAAVASINLVRKFYYFDEITSTSDWAARLIQRCAGSGDLDGTLIVAASQTAGRGRFKRKWSAPSGRALLFSMILDASAHGQPSAGFVSQLLSAGPVAVCDAVRQATHLPAVVKVPNDVLIGNRKLAGILTEQTQCKGRSFVILGIGVNVEQQASELPRETRLPATSLRVELECEITPSTMLTAILKQLESLIRPESRALVTKRMNVLCATIGKHVEVETARGTVSGIAMSLTPDGALIVRTESGVQQVVYSGDIRQVSADAIGS